MQAAVCLEALKPPARPSPAGRNRGPPPRTAGLPPQALIQTFMDQMNLEILESAFPDDVLPERGLALAMDMLLAPPPAEAAAWLLSAAQQGGGAADQVAAAAGLLEELGQRRRQRRRQERRHQRQLQRYRQGQQWECRDT